MSVDENIMKEESAFWDNIASKRSKDGNIPETADLRRANRVIAAENIEPVDRIMTRMVEGRHIDKIINTISLKKESKVLDICCGPGWMALELARNGHHVEAYDISEKAINLAKRMLDENPFKENFGSVNYHLADVSNVDLGENKFDAITGMSAWHHIPGLDVFMQKAKRSLKPGGIIVTVDDLEQGMKESFLKRLFMLLLPVHGYSYAAKMKAIFRRIKTKSLSEIPEDKCSPLDEMQHENDLVEDIAKIWYKDFDVIYDKKYCLFCLDIMRRLRGPGFIRYPLGYILSILDRFLCLTNLFIPYCRIIIGKSR